jgi:hypothetical protein
VAFQSRSGERRHLRLLRSGQMVPAEVEGLERLGGLARVKRKSEGEGVLRLPC